METSEHSPWNGSSPPRNSSRKGFQSPIHSGKLLRPGRSAAKFSIDSLLSQDGDADRPSRLQGSQEARNAVTASGPLDLRPPAAPPTVPRPQALLAGRPPSSGCVRPMPVALHQAATMHQGIGHVIGGYEDPSSMMVQQQQQHVAQQYAGACGAASGLGGWLGRPLFFTLAGTFHPRPRAAVYGRYFEHSAA